jgi:hypothetical protein
MESWVNGGGHGKVTDIDNDGYDHGNMIRWRRDFEGNGEAGILINIEITGILTKG